MRLTIDPTAYSQLWEVTANRPTHSIAELALADSVLGKLEAVGVPEEEEEDYVLEAVSAELELSDDEVVFVRDRLEKELRRGQTRENRDLLALATPIDAEAVRVVTDRREAQRAAERAAQLARAEEAIDEELATKQAELDQVRQELGTARTELEGVLAEVEAQREAVR